MTRFPGALAAVALPSGEWAVAFPGSHIQTHAGRIDRPVGVAGAFDISYLDITTVGGFKIAGQAQCEPHSPNRGTWVWENGQWTQLSTEAPGTYPVMFDRNGHLHIATPERNGSQGWRYVSDDGDLVSGDDTLNAQRRVGLALGLSDIWEYTHLGGVCIGQGETGCDVIVDGARRRLEDGDTHFIRVRHAAGTWAVGITKLAQGEACVGWFTRGQLAGLPTVTLAPAPAPQPEHPVSPVVPPAPEPAPMPETFPHSALLQQFAAKFPLPQTPGGGEEHENKCRAWCLKLAEQVRFTTRDATWGVKRAAGPQSKDTIAKDLGNGKLIVFDLMSGAGTGAPTLNVQPHGEEVNGQIFIPVNAVDHLRVPEPHPHPEPHPAVLTDRELLLKLMAKIDRLSAHFGIQG